MIGNRLFGIAGMCFVYIEKLEEEDVKSIIIERKSAC